MRAAIATPAYALNRHNVNAYSQDIQRQQEQGAYKPWDDSKSKYHRSSFNFKRDSYSSEFRKKKEDFAKFPLISLKFPKRNHTEFKKKKKKKKKKKRNLSSWYLIQH